ncbi:MAG: hypothetical protein OEY25_00420 [Candidatus Aminicenantes bacterium]|nr:hypothetical protein [Candidatus Aminicenantes bacterium]MDH5465862.1 hypothetical protein [Candidatus Aminicenantes bacterium]MDH5704534.1 hypothetical protein [Candidatus Aminicenantes bacterium]
MRLKKFIVGVSLPLFFSSLLFSQSLTELAKKERERRAMLKGKKFAVVTNADLGKLRKRPALSISGFETSGTTPVPANMSSARDQAEPTESGDISRPGTQQDSSVDQREPGQPSIEELEAKYYQAREYTELLTIKLRGLWQEYYSMDDMTDRNSIQKQIAETSLQIEKAQRDEALAKQEMEKGRTRVRRRP